VHPAGITNIGKLDTESLIRLKKAFRRWQKHVKKGVPSEKIFFVSSVKCRKNEYCKTSSEMMKETLVRWGVPGKQIIVSNDSNNTLDDILNSVWWIRKYNFPEPIENVSSWYHIPRIMLIYFIFRSRLGFPQTKFIFAGAANFSWIFKEPWKMLRMFHLRILIK